MNNFYNPTLQTKFDNDGDCLSACIATLFDIHINDVPWFAENDDNWIFNLSDWMQKMFGKYVVSVKFNSVEQVNLLGDSLIITTIISPNPDVERHAVITQKYRIIFDPMNGPVNEIITEDHDATFLIIGDVRLKELDYASHG
jgi:hypothetical protein